MNASKQFKERLNKVKHYIEQRVQDSQTQGAKPEQVRSHLWCKFINEKLLGDDNHQGVVA